MYTHPAAVRGGRPRNSTESDASVCWRGSSVALASLTVNTQLNPVRERTTERTTAREPSGHGAAGTASAVTDTSGSVA